MGGGRGPMGAMGAMGRPTEKAKDFSGTLKRLLRYFVPEKFNLAIVLFAAIVLIAQGIKIANPDLLVLAAGGDGDGSPRRFGRDSPGGEFLPAELGGHAAGLEPGG